MTRALVIGAMALLMVAAVAGPADGLTARVRRVNGVPVLEIDGKREPPLLFFHNTDIPGARSMAFLRSQVRLASAAGIHLYSLPYAVPRKADGRTPDWDNADARLDPFVQEDPQARFLLRLYVGPHRYWAVWRELPAGDIARYDDGSSGNVSAASESLRRIGDDDLRATVRHCEVGRHADRIFAYQPGAPNIELFEDQYRERGPDISDANSAGFRRWLARRYRSDAALARAWATPDVTLASAAVPVPPAGRFPMHGSSDAKAFYDPVREREWVDYSAYSSDVVASNVLRWARIIKQATARRKLAAFFYGYTFELPGSFSGHDALRRVLQARDVDALAAPISYRGRAPGGPGCFMSPVDSVTLHGKLWFNEDDTRTHLIRPENVPAWWLTPDGQTRNMHETLEVLERNTGSALAHRAGTWWMDLGAAGAFDHPDLWDVMRRRLAEYRRVLLEPEPYQPEVAVLIDEGSKLCVEDDWTTTDLTLYTLRDEVAMTGARVGWYLLSDYVRGLTPRCQTVVFANAFDVPPATRRAIHDRLERDGSTAIWQFAPGWFGAGEEGVRALTGLSVKRADGRLGSRGVGALEGTAWGRGNVLRPRLAVEDMASEPLALYTEGGGVSAARKRVGRWTSILIADPGPTRDALRRLVPR